MHKALQECGKLGFCYLCGKAFMPGNKPSRDHVPPRAMFLPEDRGDPLILPTHFDCNQGESIEDELVGQFVSLVHRKQPSPERLRLDVVGGHLRPDGQRIALMRNVHLQRIIWRWVRGFHVALYGEYLPNDNNIFVHPPMPSGRQNGDRIIPDPIHPQQLLVPAEIKKNRAAKNLDVLTCCNGKCCYETVFVLADNGQPLCFWALRIYDWEKLGEPRWVSSHGCIGCYEPPAGIPQGASRGTRLEFPFPNRDPLDPFEQ